jgi:Fe-S-cluster containining protein
MVKRMDARMNKLAQLHADIEERVQAIRREHLDWLCRLGCDSCCRQLADIPRFTEAEWDWLRVGLASLPQEQVRKISQDIAALAEQPSHPIVCPLLDQLTGACMVYAYRPVACRTYGFYIQRGQGLYCKEIALPIADGHWAGVVWGNQDAIERRLRSLGDTRELADWLRT